MQERSSRFDLAITAQEPAAWVTRVNIRSGSKIIVVDVPWTDGLITLDATAASRRTLTATFVDPDGTLTPRLASDPLAPFGNEIEVFMGFRWVDLTEELLPVGIFRMTDSVPSTDGTIKVKADDRSIVVAGARWETPFGLAAGLPTVDGAVAIVESRYIGRTYELVTSNATVPLTIYEEGDRSGDPWTNFHDLLQSDGLEGFFGPSGQVIIRRPPDPIYATPVATYAPGPTSVRRGVSNAFNSRDARNVFIAIGEGSGIPSPFRGVAEVTDATSPLHPSRFGRRPRFLSSPLITSQESADRAAETMKRREEGASETTTFEALPNPAHEGGDVVRVVEASLGIDDSVVLRRFSLPFRIAGPVTYECGPRRAA